MMYGGWMGIIRVVRARNGVVRLPWTTVVLCVVVAACTSCVKTNVIRLLRSLTGENT